MINVSSPCLLTAAGDADRLEVLRSPLAHSSSRIYSEVRQFIAQHGLVLSARETFEDAGWMYGSVEMSVFVAPETRNAIYALA